MPGDALVGLGGIALFLAAGAGLTELLPVLRRLRAGERLAHAWLLGVVWVAGGLWVLSHGLDVPLRRPAVLALAVAPALVGLATRLLRRGESRRRRRRPLLAARLRGRGVWEVAAALAAAWVSVAVLCEAVTNPPRDWDGRMTWGIQARYVRAEGTVDAVTLRDEKWFVNHPQYPLLLPLAQVAVLELAGAGDDEHPYRPLYAAFLPAWLLVLHGAARRWAGRRAAALALLAAALAPFPAFSREGGAAGSYSDLPLACFCGAGLLLLLGPRPRAAHGIAAALLLGGAVLTKNEGTFLALAAVGAAGLFQAWRALRRGRQTAALQGRLAPVAVAALGVALALALFASWRSGIPNRHDEFYAQQLTLAAFVPEAVTRAPAILAVAARRTLSPARWSLLWWTVPVVLLAGRRGLARPVALPLAVAAATPLAVGWAAYTIAASPTLVVVTWNRLLLQSSLPLLLLFALALGALLRPELPGAAGSP